MSDQGLNTAPPEVAATAVAPLRRFRSTEAGFRWEEVPLKQYKEEGTHFKSITRQTLFSDADDQPCELRYFEVQPGGHSTFERHVHTHAILILRGRGLAVVGNQVFDVGAMDLLHVGPQTWHQLIAADEEAMGFLCQVPCDRDRPTRPSAEERDALLSDPEIGHIIRL